MRVLSSLLVCLWLVPTTALAQEPADPGPRIKALIETFEGARDAKKKRECLSELVAIGEPAFKAVETRATELAAKAAEARTAVGDDPDPAALETLRKLDALTRAAAKTRDGIYMAIVVAAFVEVEKQHKDLNLVFPEQFAGLKSRGKRAVRGSILLMKDLDLFEDRYRYKAWEVLADLGDKSVVKELKAIAADFLMEDQIREGAVRALSALGDPELLNKKIRELENEMREDPQRQIGLAQDIASLCHHGRLYQRAAATYAGLITMFEGILKERAAEMEKAQVDSIKGAIASFGYNGACALSLAKNYPGAYAMLAKCLKSDADAPRQLQNILRDGDLANLRAEKHFKAWYAGAKKGEFPERPPGAPPVPKSTEGEKPAAEDPGAGDPAKKPAGESSGEAKQPEKTPEKAGGEPPPEHDSGTA